MKIDLRKRTVGSLRKLTKVSNENEVLGDPIYVRLEDVEDNIESLGTPITTEVLDAINWKDNTSVEMVPVEGTSLPEKKLNVTQIVSLSNGEVWCVPGVDGVEAFPLGNADLGEYLKKNHQDYENLILLGSNTKIGALPADYNETGDSNPSTYLDIADGAINFKINGQTKHSLKTDGVSFTQGNAELCLCDSEISLKNHSAGTTIGLMNDSFYIKGNNTQISEDLSLNKLNFFTNLEKAVYGNATIYLEFYSDQVRFKSSSGSNLLTIKTDGTIYSGSNPYTYIVNSNNVNSYIKPYLDNNFASYFDTQFNSKFYDKFNYYLRQDFESRLDEYFKNKFYEHYVDVCSDYTIIFTGCSTEVDNLIIENDYLYKIVVSDTASSSSYLLAIKGTEISSNSIYVAETGYYYYVTQSYSDGDNYDTVSVSKYDASNSYVGQVYIRGIYRY